MIKLATLTSSTSNFDVIGSDSLVTTVLSCKNSKFYYLYWFHEKFQIVSSCECWLHCSCDRFRQLQEVVHFGRDQGLTNEWHCWLYVDSALHSSKLKVVYVLKHAMIAIQSHNVCANPKPQTYLLKTDWSMTPLCLLADHHHHTCMLR